MNLSPTPGTSWLLKNGMVVDAENCTTRRADVRIADGRIAEIGTDLPTGASQVMDCTGRIIAPGFIDSHVHVESSMVLPHAFGQAILPQGTTAIIADPHEVVNVAGAKGLHEFIDECRKAPVDIFVCVPSSVPATPFDTNGAGNFTAAEMAPFVHLPQVVGLGEVMCWPDVINGAKEITEKIALFEGKVIDGHTAGLPAECVPAYVAAGVQNDHECADAASMLQRYEEGMNIYVREGSAARNARELLTCAKERGLDVSKFAFCTDDKHLATIAQEGHISYIVRMALELGFSWGEVSRMASLNPCRYYHLADRGDVKPGFVADLVITDETCTHIDCVFKNGIRVAADHKLLTPPTDNAETASYFANTVTFKELTAADFILPEELRHVAIQLVDGQLLTEKLDLTSSDEWKTLTRLATIERYGKNGNIAVCALSGYGIRNGAVATSVSHDSHNVVCAGDNEGDMAVACNRLKALGGGYVIASGGKIVGELPLPAYGLMCTYDAEKTSEIIEQLEHTAHEMGVNPNIDAFITLSFTALPVIPRLRLLDTGLFDLATGEFIHQSTKH